MGRGTFEQKRSDALYEGFLLWHGSIICDPVPVCWRVSDSRLLRGEHVSSCCARCGEWEREAVHHAQCTEFSLRSGAGWHTRQADCCTGFPKQDHLGGWCGLLRYHLERHVPGHELLVARDQSHVDALFIKSVSGSQELARQRSRRIETASWLVMTSTREHTKESAILRQDVMRRSSRDVFIEKVVALPNKPIEETDPQDLDLDDNSITVNTRISFLLHANPDVLDGEVGPHPNTVVLLTADAFGVLPPISVLSSKEVMYHFVSGFTSKLAGTEVGIIEPIPSFSSCFGAALMPRKVNVYAQLVTKKMSQHQTRRAPLNTGWACGACGEGKRISIRNTRALLNAEIERVFSTDPTLSSWTILFSNWDAPSVVQVLMRLSWVPERRGRTRPRTAVVKLWDTFRKNFADKYFAELGIESCMWARVALLLLPLETKCLNLWSLVSFFFSEVAPNSKCIVDQMVECGASIAKHNEWSCVMKIARTRRWRYGYSFSAIPWRVVMCS